MKKIIYQFRILLLVILFAIAISPNALAQGNSNEKGQSIQNQTGSALQIDPNENYGHPWINYKGIGDREMAKSAWITDNPRAYQNMMSENEDIPQNSNSEAAPPNDLCSGAIPISYGSNTLGFTTQATVDNTGGTCGTDATTKGIWYSFVGSGNTTEISTCVNNYDTYLSVYSGTCGTLQCEWSDDDGCVTGSGLGSRIVMPTTAGEQYYILVHGKLGVTGGFRIILNEQIANPPLGQPCPLKLVLVLDESGSIGSNASFVRSGVNAFVSGLEGTGTEMAIVEFTTSASRTTINGSNGFQTVDATYKAAVAAYLPTGYVPAGGTNWAAAFDEVWSLNNDEGTADLVIFFTDGLSSLAPAITASNTVKTQGSHLFMLGVGSGVSVPNLQAVSGPLQAPPTPLAQADFGLQADFANIEASLIALSTAFLTDYYADIDGDGFGAGPATNACDAPGVNFVTNNLDCDDADATVYPGAPDLCDGLANDCSDPNWPIPNSADSDDDGDGLSECAGDCDDADANVYPGAPEICDGKDNDCSGAIEDADCDGVEDACDVCPGGDDSVDADGDGLPDCANEPTVYDPSWECDKKGKKITVCHVDDNGNRFELCINKNAAAGHLSHGDFLGPCIGCDANKMETSTAVEELHVHAYPVPTSDLLTIEVTSAMSTDANVNIVDFLGRVIHSSSVTLIQGVRFLEIDVSSYPAGVYMLSIESESTTETIKVIVE